MKCKKCGEEINLVIFGMPEDICYGCGTGEEKEEVAERNLKLAKKKYNIEENDK
jgi:hypothetical protein